MQTNLNKLMEEVDDKMLKGKNEHTKTMTSFVTKPDIARLYERFKEFVCFGDFDKFKEEIRPSVEGVRKDQEVFGFEHRQMKEMIRRFDELLADKANKMSLTELEHKIGEQFL